MRLAFSLLFFPLMGFSATTELSFEEAITIISQRSPALSAKTETAEAVRSRNLSSKLSLLPTISLEGSLSRTKDSTSPTPYSSSLLQGVGEINLIRFGADFSAMGAARHEIRAAEEDRRDESITVESSAVRTLTGWILAENELAVRTRMAEIERAAYEIARAGYKQGLLASQESEKVLIDLENARASQTDAEIRAVTSRAKLRESLGHTDVKKDWPWKDRVKRAVISVKDAETHLRSRPDWLAAEARVKSVDYLADQRWGEMMPSLDARFSYGYGSRYFPSQPETSWEGRLILTIPLFDRLEGYSKYREQVHKRGAAEAELEQVRRTALREWESASRALDLAATSASTRQKTVETARKLYEDNVKRFHRGLVSANDLVVDQNRLADAELFALRGWAAAHEAFADVCHALGQNLAQCLAGE